jgi:hypothetical protein
VKIHPSSIPARLYKYERLVPHLLRHSLFHQSASLELQLEKKREREREEREREREREMHFLERTFYICLSYLLALYWLSILRNFLLGFLPHEDFPG